MSIEQTEWISTQSLKEVQLAANAKPVATTTQGSTTIMADEFLVKESPLKKYGFIFKTMIGKKVFFAYQWKTSEIVITMDEDVALKRWKNVKTTKFVSMVNVQTKFFGTTQENILPILDATITNYTNLEKEFINFIVNKAGSWELNDTLRQAWFLFLDDYQIVQFEDVVVFRYAPRPKQTAEQQKKSQGTEIVTTVMKERMDWYFRFQDYQMTSATQVPIGSKYDIGEGYWSIFGAYTPSLRWAMFSDKTSFNKDAPPSDETSGDPVRTLQRRQYQVIKRLGWMNYIAATRRSWKTWLLALLAVREIIREPTSMQEQWRPIRVLYIWLTDKKNKAARDYILRMSAKYRASKMFRWRSEENRLSFVDQEGNELGVVDFISAKDYEAGVGEYADLILIDEAARVKEAIYEAILPIVTNEWARLICVSTIDRRTKKNWFYRKVLEAEKTEFLRSNIDQRVLETWKKYWLNNKKYKKDFTRNECAKIRKDIMYEREMVWMRYTIDDIEYITDREREFSKRVLREYPNRYYAELYSVFPDEWKIFPYERVIKEHEKISQIRFDYIVLWYDPAIMMDRGAVVVTGYDRMQSKIYYLEEVEMPRETYNQHPDVMKELKQKYSYLVNGRDPNKVYIAADVTGNLWLISLFDLKWCPLDLKVWYHWGSANTRDKDWTHKVAKEYLVDTMRNVMESNGCVMSTLCKNTIDEMNYFQIIENPITGRQSYEAIEWHDDFVNAAMIGTYFVFDYMVEKDHIMARNIWRDEVPEWLTYQEVREWIAQQEKLKVSTKTHWATSTDKFLQKYIY